MKKLKLALIVLLAGFISSCNPIQGPDQATPALEPVTFSESLPPASTPTSAHTPTPSPTSPPTPIPTPESRDLEQVKIAYYLPDPNGVLAGRIYLLAHPDQAEVVQTLNAGEYVLDLFFSPDGEDLFFTAGSSESPQRIYRVSTLASAPGLIYEAPPASQGFSHALQDIHWQPGTNNLVMEVHRIDFMGPIAGYAVVDAQTGSARNIRITEDRAGRHLSVFSPDRRFVVAVGPESMSLVNLDTGQTFDNVLKYLPGGIPYSDAFFFPAVTWDSGSSYFLTAILSGQSTYQQQQYEMYRISVDGLTQQIGTIPGTYADEDRPYPQFSLDGQWMFYHGADGLHRFNLKTGNDQFIHSLETSQYRWQYASISPDGQQLVFRGQDGLYWLSVADGNFQRVAAPGWIGPWSPNSIRCAASTPKEEVNFVRVVDAAGEVLSLFNAVTFYGMEWVDGFTLTYFIERHLVKSLYLQIVGEEPLLIMENLPDGFVYAAWMNQSP